jgi:tyrosyl-tRNA synthetase
MSSSFKQAYTCVFSRYRIASYRYLINEGIDMTMTLYDHLKARDLVHEITSEAMLDNLNKGDLTFYVGFDPTGNSFHVGQLAIFNVMRLMQQAGNQAIALLGGATGRVGDPGGKSKERPLLDDAALAANALSLQAQLMYFLQGKPSMKAELMNNLDWLGQWHYLDFLRDVGKHFSVNQMMMRDSVQSRLAREGAGISYAEFSYMLLQAYDFAHLAKTKNCLLQVGGADQWGNIVSGIDLARRLTQKTLYGLTIPLLTQADGTKFGKSEAGTVWLSSDRTSPFQFYQYFVRTADEDVGRLLRMLTNLPLADIDMIMKESEKAPHLRQAQKALAASLTQWVHGQAALARVMHASEVLYGGAITDLDDRTIREIFEDVPSHVIARDRIKSGISLVDALVDSSACASKSVARRLIESGGVYINNQASRDTALLLTEADLASPSYLVLRTGKRSYRLLVIED